MELENNLENDFDTLENLQKEYPIGKVLSWRKPVRMVGCYINQADLDYFYKNCKDVKILSDYEVAYTLPSTPLETVDGYLFDGKHWFAMKETWDGWVRIEEKEPLWTLKN